LSKYYWNVVAVKWSDVGKYAIAGILLVGLLFLVPYRHVELRTSSYEATPQSWHNASIILGGPMITLVTVELNRTARIQFMHLEGVWPRNVLLAAFSGTVARYDYRGEHYTIVIEVASNGPIWIRVRYVYVAEIEGPFFHSPLDSTSPIIFP
jgi:hypothetical protein